MKKKLGKEKSEFSTEIFYIFYLVVLLDHLCAIFHLDLFKNMVEKNHLSWLKLLASILRAAC